MFPFTYFKLQKDEVKVWTPVSKSSVLLRQRAKLDPAKRWPAYLKLHRNAEALKQMKKKRTTTPVTCRTRTVELVENQQKEESRWRSEQAKFIFVNGIGLQPKLSWEAAGLANVNVGAPVSLEDLADKLQGFRQNTSSSISDLSDISEVASTASTDVVTPCYEDDWEDIDMKNKIPDTSVEIPEFERSYPQLKVFRVPAATQY